MSFPLKSTRAQRGGNVVDEVQFDDENGWPDFTTGTDGAGGSIELCDVNSDNNMSSSWRTSTTDVGVMINGFAVKGTPGAANTVTCEIVPDATITAMINNTFDPADVTIDVGQTVRWTNGGGFHNVNGELTAQTEALHSQSSLLIRPKVFVVLL